MKWRHPESRTPPGPPEAVAAGHARGTSGAQQPKLAQLPPARAGKPAAAREGDATGAANSRRWEGRGCRGWAPTGIQSTKPNLGDN